MGGRLSFSGVPGPHRSPRKDLAVPTGPHEKKLEMVNEKASLSAHHQISRWCPPTVTRGSCLGLEIIPHSIPWSFLQHVAKPCASYEGRRSMVLQVFSFLWLWGKKKTPPEFSDFFFHLFLLLFRLLSCFQHKSYLLD